MTIEDLGSENGTYVREARIAPGKQVPFSTGDVVRVGDVILIFRL
jgi:pSer/pThr/pTyr-binding forkhead associated (FHA) protein